MSFAEVSQHEEHRSPNSNEEYNDENKNSPFGNGYIPKISPVTSVGLEVRHDQPINFDNEK